MGKEFPSSVIPGKPVLGKVPDGWSITTYGEVLEPVKRKVNLIDDDEYQLVTAKRSRGGIIPRAILKGSDISVKSQYHIKTGDFLISKRQIVHGACGIVPEQLDKAIVSNEYAVLASRGDILLEYLRYFSHTIYFQQTCFQSSIGVHIEKMLFKIDDWFRWKIPLPPIEEQRAIAEILGTWDEAIALTESLISALEVRKKGLMQKLLTGEVRFSEFDGDWEEVRLGDLVNTYSGGTPSRSNPEYYDGDIPWIKSGEVNQTYIWETKEKITQDAIENSSAKLVEPDTVLVALYGATAGVVGISKIQATINQALLAVIPNGDLLDKEFMFHSLMQDMPRIVHKFQQGGQPNLSATTVKSSKFRLPKDTDEQEKIAKIADVIDSEINIYNDINNYLQQQKKGLMQQLLTGQVPVKV